MEHLKIEFPHGKKKISHVSMTGGSIFVPPEKMDTFAQIYIDEVKKGTKLFLVEQNNLENFRYFVDIDHKSDRELTEEELMKMVTDLVVAVGEGSAMVLISEPKKTHDGKIKTGVHIVWYEYIVTVEDALQLREEHDHITNGSIDAAVYKAGIRLPWSHKYDHKSNRVEGYYVPMCIITQNGTVREVDSKPSVDTFKLCCVRIKKSKRREGTFSQAQLEKSLDDPELYINTEFFIRNYLEGQGRTNAKNIFEFKGNYLINTDSRYCENKGGRHSNNHVYFVITKNGYIYQKCHCRCDVDRKKGTCEHFTGKKYMVSKKIHKKLYPDKYKYNFLDAKNIPGIL